MKQVSFLAAALWLPASFSLASELTQLEETVVTATRIEQPLQQTLSSTTIITQEEIRNSQAVDVVTILRSVTGVEYAQNGGIGKPASLYLRGSSSTQMLVLLDGVRINSATTGTAAIQDLMLDQVERIEIVRGNVSSLYGSEAIGGVVQIFTRKGQSEPSYNASVGAGSLGTQKISAGMGGKHGNTQYSLQASSVEMTGVSAINPTINNKANPDVDGYRNTSVSTNFRQMLDEGNSITVSAFGSFGQNQYDSAYGPATDHNTNSQKIGKYSISSENRLSNNWHSHLKYALGLDEGHDYKNGFPTTTSLYKTSNELLNWQNTLQLGNAGTLLLGAENLVQKVESDVSYTVGQRIINSLYAGWSANHGAQQIQANLRSDNNSQYGMANTGLLGYGYAFNASWRATASYSTAFRAPTFNDLYYPGYSNPSLEPEYSNNSEAGLHYAAAGRAIDIVYFDNRIRNFIILDSSYIAQNLNQARISGSEITYSEILGDTTLKFSLTSQNPRDETADTLLVRRAKLHGSTAITHKAGKWRWKAECIGSGDREDSYTDPTTFATSRKTLPGYAVFNLTASVLLNRETDLTLRADNLTEQNDTSVYSYNPQGRTFFINMRYQH